MKINEVKRSLNLKSKALLSIFSALLMVFALNCANAGGGGDNGGGTGGPCIDKPNSRAVTDSAATDVSHNAGQSCMKAGCHVTGGALAFTVAGTMYTDNTGAAVSKTKSVSFATGGVLPVDTCGNFYSTTAKSGIVTSSTGNPMGNAINAGNSDCNSCHDGTSQVIGNQNTRIY